MNGDENPTDGTEKHPDGLPTRSQGALTRDKLGRIAATGLLTGRQKRFVKNMVSTGGKQSLSAELAGYASPAVSASLLMRLPHVVEALRVARIAAIEGVAMLAPETLREVMGDKMAPAAARVSAAKLALELAGHVAKPVSDRSLPGYGDNLETLTVEQLEKLVADGSDALVKLGRMIDVTPQSPKS